jgi:hypothetical protein
MLNIVGDVYFPIKKWEVELDYYKDLINYKVLYFHCFININKEDINKVWLFYEKDTVLNNIIINYRQLYNILIKQYSKQSILDFIYYYYKDFSIL